MSNQHGFKVFSELYWTKKRQSKLVIDLFKARGKGEDKRE